MSIQKKKRNHWVPQAYLRYFAADEAKRKIWTFSKTEGDPELKPIQKVAVKHYLYAPQKPDGLRDYSFEDRLSGIEQWFGHPIWRAAATDVVDLSDITIRKMLALAMAVMYLRNPAQLEVSRLIHQNLRDFMLDSGSIPEAFEHKGKEYPLDPTSWPEFRDADDEDTKQNWIKSISSATWLAEIFLKMRWAMAMAPEPILITSDNPVTPIHTDLGFRGFANEGTTVLFPLSPTRVLCLDHRMQERDSQYYPVPGRGEATNLLIWRNAIDRMYSSREIDSVLAELIADADRQGF